MECKTPSAQHTNPHPAQNPGNPQALLSHKHTHTHFLYHTHSHTLAGGITERLSLSHSLTPSLSLSLSLTHTHSVTALPQVGWTMEEVMPVMNGEEPEKEVIGQDEMVLLLFYYSCA